MQQAQSPESCDNEENKKKKFKIPDIEVPDSVKIFILAFLKQVGVVWQFSVY